MLRHIRADPASVYEPELGKFKVPTLRNVDLLPRFYAAVAEAEQRLLDLAREF